MAKLSELCRLTWGVLAQGWLTKKMGQKLLGHWGAALIYRRLLWSVLEHSYRWLEGLPEERASRI
eukprot:7567823-Heterocapsa_arctica.AAC.1